MQPAAKDEMAFKQGARVPEYLENFVLCHGPPVFIVRGPVSSAIPFPPANPKSARKHGKVMLGWIFSGHFGWRGGFN
jgi:hypothetical protein